MEGEGERELQNLTMHSMLCELLRVRVPIQKRYVALSKVFWCLDGV